MKPLKVVGWEMKKSEKSGKVGLLIYAVRDIDVSADSFIEGEGSETCRLYISPEYCKYSPKVGDMIIPVEGRYGIDQIYVVN